MEDVQVSNKNKALKKKAAALKDSDLFSVNVDKKGLKSKRVKLAKDRFKEEER
jgi:hypothetical protein